jgi:flagellar operon protein
VNSLRNDFLDNIVSRPYSPVAPASVNPRHQQTDKGPSFADVLRQAESPSSGLKVSAHASQRMQQRGLSLSGADWSQIGKAVDKAEMKGAKEAYLMYGNAGFVVNVPNRTVITAMVNQEDTLVTNIDSVVIVPRLDR